MEYWLQKKTIGGWSHVTSYSELEQAKRNFASCVGNGMSGYSWRLVEVKELEVSMLNDVVEVEKDYFDKDDPLAKGWSRPADFLIQDAPKSSGWGQPSSDWGKPASNSPSPSQPSSSDLAHGLTGSVWLVHYGQRAKVRVKANEAQKYYDEGYVRGGPRTQFE